MQEEAEVQIAERRSQERARAADEAVRQQAAMGTYLQQGHLPNEVQVRVRAWQALRHRHSKGTEKKQDRSQSAAGAD